MAEQRIGRGWESYTESIDGPLRLLWLDLLMENRLEDFPYKGQLEKILDDIDRVRRADRYGYNIARYRPEIEKLQDTLDSAYDFINKILKYVKTTPFKDNSRVTGDLARIIETRKVGDEERFIMKEYAIAAKALLEKYKPSASPSEMPEKKKVKLKAEATALLLIAVLGLSFATLGILSNMRISSGGIPTGSFVAPTARIAGVSFELLYVITSSTVLFIYFLGKLMKRW